MIKYTGYCTDYKLNHSYKVEFLIPSSSTANHDIILYEHSPIILKTNAEDLFTPIKTQSATISIVSKDYIFGLYNVDFSVVCNIYKDNSLIFTGYVTPNIYTQDYQYVSVITIECISKLAKSKYISYSVIDSEPAIYPVTQIIRHILFDSNTSASTPILIYCAPERIGIDDYIHNDGLNHIFLDERNFFDDNEEHTPWKQYDVIEEICKILGVSMTEHVNQYYMIQYRSGLNTQYKQTVYKYDLSYTISTISQTQREIYNEQNSIDLFAGSNNSLSLEDTYKSIEIKSNTYPYEDAINKLLSSDQWELYSNIYNNMTLNDLSNTPYAPYLKFERSDGKVYSIYYMYYKTDTMSPHQYKMLLDNDQYDDFIDDPINPNDWIFAIINQPGTAQTITSSEKIGASLMKIASYEISDLKLVNSLTWKDQIVLYLGLNNLNINNYVNPNDPSDISYNEWRTAYNALRDDVFYYLANCYTYYNSDYTPDNPLLEIESESDVIVKDDSYLVISGKIGINDWEYEDSQKDEWAGSDNFSKPFGYMLIDQEQRNEYIAWNDVWKQINNRKYNGFPLLDIQIRIGDKICCVANHVSVDADNHTEITTQYKWMTAAEYNDYITDTDADSNFSYYTHFEIPVGTDKFSFYKLHEITDTCDWRLGLDGASGFAIPLPKEAGLSGKLKIYINSIKNDLFVHYIDGYSDFISLPTTQRRVEIVPNPHNMWNTSISWNNMELPTVNYDGCYPNNVIIQDLKFDIKPVKFYTITDTAKSNANNKQTDHVYTNIINQNAAIDDKKSVEVKINTQDAAKNRSFSSLLKKDNDDKYQYIEKMWTGEYDGNQNEIYRIEENNVIDTYRNHYSDKKIIFDCILKETDWSPLQILTNRFSNISVPMIVNSQEKDFHADKTKIQLVEI